MVGENVQIRNVCSKLVTLTGVLGPLRKTEFLRKQSPGRICFLLAPAPSLNLRGVDAVWFNHLSMIGSLLCIIYVEVAVLADLRSL